ncbi:MAG: DNA-processing protein DprA [Deltaproteobacteria bacterium]
MAEHIASRYERMFDWLALERVPRVGPLTMARLFEAFGGPRSALNADADEIRRRTGLSERLARSIADFDPPEEEIRKDLELIDKLGVRVITRWDADYPAMLQEIYDPPALLFVRGEITPKDSRAVAVVGTRNPSRYGFEMAERISAELARAGVTIVSGLARGIDAACHSAAIKAGGRTIGVLGCGIDVLYPRENKSLMEEMVSSGAVITEFRPGIAPLATNFYRRNRIVSGLAKGTVVVEATTKSGSLITARHALDQNREVFAVPGNAMNLRSRGPHHLIKQGAALAESAEDILEALFPTGKLQVEPLLFEHQDEELQLSETARRVLERIDPDPVPIDILVESLDMEAGKLAGVLLELELKGLIRQHPGKMFALASR